MASFFSYLSKYIFPKPPFLEWSGSDELRIGDIRFRLSYDTDVLKSGSNEKGHYLLGKPRHMVEKALEIKGERKISRVFEMGILRGGSVVLYDLIFSPDLIVAIDHDPNPVFELDEYIRNHRKSKVVRPYYGVSQDDREMMENILSSEFPGCNIDLIVDDASHLYSQTREALNICFPYLASGGLYIIEDWGWAHWSGEYWQKDNDYFKDKPALSNLLVELFMLSASRPDMVSELRVDHNKIMIRKGDVKLPEGRFDIADHYLLRGKEFTPIL